MHVQAAVPGDVRVGEVNHHAAALDALDASALAANNVQAFQGERDSFRSKICRVFIYGKARNSG